MKRKDFTERLVHMLKPFKDCSDWFLDYHNFVLDENYILVSKDGQQVKLSTFRRGNMPVPMKRSRSFSSI